MIQVLMAKAAHDRIASEIAALSDQIELVTAVGPDAFERNGNPMPAAELAPDVVWVSFDCFKAGAMQTYSKAILRGEKAPAWVQTANAGLDNVLFRQIFERGVRLTKGNAQGVPIAEYVLAHAISLIVPIDRQRELQAQKRWASTPYREISQTRWTLVGYGSIGQEIAQRVKAFGAHLTVVRRSSNDDGLADAVGGQSELLGILPNSDVVVLACPLTEETRNLAGEAFFEALKPGSILINVGRGGLVDEDALRLGLDRQQPAQAVLDVVQTEPLPVESWIWEHPQIRLSAHTSPAGGGTEARGDTQFLQNLKRYLEGQPLLNEASPWEAGIG